MDTAEILNKAADVIETRGWHRGSFTPDGTLENPTDPKTCPVCVLGAINVAAGRAAELDLTDRGTAQAAAEQLAAYLGLTYRLYRYTLVEVLGDEWNDSAAADEAEVITALREAAKAAGGAS